jgi:Sugar (and other) transporter
MIFNEAGSTLSSNNSAIVVGTIQLIGALISTMLVEKAGRKLLMVSSALNCALGLASFGAYDFSKHHGVDVSSYNWIPLSSVCFCIFAANLGKSSIKFNIA